MTPNRTVWVVNLKGYDYTPAESYGNLAYLTQGNVNVFSVDNNLKELREQLRASRKEDYVLPCGAISLNMLVATLMMELHGKVNLLIFNLKRSQYIVRTFEKGDLWPKSTVA